MSVIKQDCMRVRSARLWSVLLGAFISVLLPGISSASLDILIVGSTNSFSEGGDADVFVV